MKIAIIGAGFFGLAAAIKIKEKYPNSVVSIYEMRSDLLLGTSGKNQFRWHLGYHYPRSDETIQECKESFSEFNKYYGKSKILSQNYYAISKKDSNIGFSDYLKVLQKHNLKFKISKNHPLNVNTIEGVIKVDEKLINISKARIITSKILKDLKINTYFNKKINLTSKFKKQFDFIIVATYENNNFFLQKKKKMKFQLVEKIIVKTPKFLKKKSYVIMDGKFMCIDPYENSKYSIIGNVKKSIHLENIDYIPNIDKKYKILIQKYYNNKKNFSRFDEINDDYKYFFNKKENLKFHSSFYVLRCTEPYKEKTDERLTNIEIQGKIISLFAGKWVSCFEGAKKLLKILK
tara:strand:+ start:1269 stop:2309 length:1041 start_codon:yes stop_codon:yes gene_type:complete